MARSEIGTASWTGDAITPDAAMPPAQLRSPSLQASGRDFVLRYSDTAAWAKPAHGGLPSWRLKRVLAYIDDNIARDISLADLAGVACLSAHHFSELFRQSMGTSPYRYVLTRRIECAKTLLRTSVMGMLDIALAVGFCDQSHFSKVFRRTTGTTPGLYRASA